MIYIFILLLQPFVNVEALKLGDIANIKYKEFE